MNEEALKPVNYKRQKVGGVTVVPRTTAALCDTLSLALQNVERRRLYPDTPEGRKRFETDAVEYLRAVEAVNRENLEKQKNGKPVIPSVEGLAAYMGLSRTSLFNYSRRSPEWKELLERLKTIMYSVRSQAASDGSMPPMIFVFDSTNNFNYRNTSEFHIRDDEPEEEPKLTIAEIRRRVGLLTDNDESEG